MPLLVESCVGLCSSAVFSHHACSLCTGKCVYACMYLSIYIYMCIHLLPTGVHTAHLPPSPDVNIDGL